MKLTFVFCFILFPILFYGQYNYSGVVLDSITHEVLPFVNIRIGSTSNGFSTDIDGMFEYESQKKIPFFEFNYIGYTSSQTVLEPEVLNKIYLVSSSIGLNEVVIDADYNPAIPIIKRVIENRKENNPENNLDYVYESYNKLIVGAEYDSLKAVSKDSAIQKMQQFFAKQDLMLIETVVKTIHKAPRQTKDFVTATRTSGLQNTTLPMLATELQSFSFYNTFFTLSDVQYISPITNEGFTKYTYKLLDEYIEGHDTIFVVSFTPKKGRAFDAMSGVLYISTYRYGVKNVIAKPVTSEGMAIIQINQRYQVIEGSWFPEQLNSTITMVNMTMEGLKIVGNSVSYLKNIQLNPPDSELEFDNITLEVNVEEKELNDISLSEARNNPLSSRDSLTYQVIDSIGKVAKLDKKLNAMESLIEGLIPLGVVDIDLNKAFNYNRYEGFRLGAGLYSSKRLMKKIKVGGYFAYGFKDKAWKYGGEIDFKLWPKKGVGLNFAYSNDIRQAGSLEIGDERKMINNQKLYELYASIYDANETWESAFRFRVKGVSSKIIAKLQRLQPLYDYSFNESIGQNLIVNYSEYYYSLLGVEVNYSPFTKVMFDGSKLVEISSRYPVLSVSYYQTVPYLTTAEMKRLLVKVEDDFTLPFIGKTNISIVGGVVNEDVPFSYLFNQKGTKNNFDVSVFESFETMNTNEFYSSAFVNAFFEQNFGTFIKKGSFQPEFAIYQGVGFGNKINTLSHGFLLGSTMEKGYYESGIKIHNIIHSGASGFGFGVFYRYGAYSLQNKPENFAYKITMSLGF